jgi:hypothetical protein|tara:strand:- start:5459 stop:5611 length:153 start_codon:yes stop_codon:yes gene_type:complete
MSREDFQTYEIKIDNCFKAAERCEKGSWGHSFWTKTAITLLNKFNIRWRN